MAAIKDSFERYMEDVAKYPRISAEREGELSKVIQKSRSKGKVEAAVDELVRANLLLVVHCVKDFDSYLARPAVRISRMDLIAEGNIALLASARKFDATYGTGKGNIRFSAYACKSIKSRMSRAIKQSRLIHIPEHHFSYWSGMKALQEEHGENLSDEIILEELGVSSNVLGMLKQGMNTHACSLEDLSSNDGESFWADVVPDTEAVSPMHEVGREDLKQFLLGEMEHLPARTRSMISVMYLNEQAPTLREMSAMYGVSSERCRQVCARGLQLLRDRIQTKCATPATLMSCA